MSITCPKCNKGLTVKEIATDLHSCNSIDPSDQAAGRLKLLKKTPRNRNYIRANFDALVSAALKDS